MYKNAEACVTNNGLTSKPHLLGDVYAKDVR